jgi:hypothetical protein
MKQAIVILGIIGSLGTFTWGLKWFSDYSAYKYEVADKNVSFPARNESVNIAIADYERTGQASYFLIVGSLLSVIAVLMLKKFGKFSAVILFITAISPVIFVPESIMVTSILLFAGILIFIVKPGKAKHDVQF